MDVEKRRLIVLWVILLLLLAAGLVLAWNTGHLRTKPDFKVSDIVTKVLPTFFVLALFVERTLEVFITAWRGQDTVKRENDLKALKESTVLSPPDPALTDQIKDKANWVAEYKCETQAIALRSALVLGILIAAVGMRLFNTFVDDPVNARSDSPWANLEMGTFHILDVLVSGGIIGGGSDAVHKMMNIITEFLDATARKVKNP
jgi:hypothetical protein